MTLAERDKAVIWHPFTQHKTSSLPIGIARGEGAYLIDEHGNRLLDLISSWWVNIHGHSHPMIAKAIYEQAMQLEHAIFANFTHEPAVLLAEQLLQLLGNQFSKVFYTDNGSTAVEVALKMAYQFWRNQGQSKRNRFISFEQGYHGDTFGAMAVGKKSGFFTHFEDLFFRVDTIPYPATWLMDEEVENKEQQVLSQLTHHLEQYGQETAALIIEPLVQGASGMRMCRPIFLRKLEQIVRSYGVLIIYDEVMTGFGRTGQHVACITAQTSPDIICLAKGLTGGFLPLSATVCKEHIYQAFLGENFKYALAHGHSFTANPLGCAASLASMKLLLANETQEQIKMIESMHQKSLPNLTAIEGVKQLRYCGTIAALNLEITADYGSDKSIELSNRFKEHNLLIRPLGKTIYLLPPYCITEAELKNAYEVIEEVIGEVTVC